jgi:hypothetical protein
MARGSSSYTLPDGTNNTLPSNSVGSGGNVVVQNSHDNSNDMNVDLSDDGDLHVVEPGDNIVFYGLTNTNEVTVKGTSSDVVFFSWGN